MSTMAARTIQQPRHDAGRQQVCTYPLEHPEPPLTPPHTPTTSPKAQQMTTAAPRPLQAQGRHFSIAMSLRTHHAHGHPRPSKSSSSPLPFDTYSPTLIPTDTPMTPLAIYAPTLPCCYITRTRTDCAHGHPPAQVSPPSTSLPSEANSPTLTLRDAPTTPNGHSRPPHDPPRCLTRGTPNQTSTPTGTPPTQFPTPADARDTVAPHQ